MATCPAAGGDCRCYQLCEERQLCVLLHESPLSAISRGCPPAVHFVGFRGEEYHSAVRVFGLPDFYHRGWDQRAQCEMAPGDTVVFAKYHDQSPSRYSFDDSNEADDPAASERRLMKP